MVSTTEAEPVSERAPEAVSVKARTTAAVATRLIFPDALTGKVRVSLTDPAREIEPEPVEAVTVPVTAVPESVMLPEAVSGKVRVLLVVAERANEPDPLTGKVSVSEADAVRVIDPEPVDVKTGLDTVALAVRVIAPEAFIGKLRKSVPFPAIVIEPDAVGA